MQLAIRHETVYRYTAALSYTIQQLRLTPRAEQHQRTVSWQISTSGQRHPFSDAYGNACHTLTVSGRHDEVRILAHGVVDIQPLFLGRLEHQESLSPLVFTVPTRLTEATASVAAFATHFLKRNPHSDDLLLLAEAIRAAVAYEGGITIVTSSAADALQLGRGVCQDHAHLFLACCHAQGIPARYVSGYIDPGGGNHAASHAWVDVWVEQNDFSGWVSVDVTHGLFASGAYCRLAIGRDYDSAAPVRGVRHGGGDESLSVDVRVSLIEQHEAPPGLL